METTNVQDLQRLNESITVCMEACRRLAVHLSQVQQTIAQTTMPWLNAGAQIPFIDPLTALQIQARAQFAPWAHLGGIGLGNVGFGGIGGIGGGTGFGGIGGYGHYGVPFGMNPLHSLFAQSPLSSLFGQNVPYAGGLFGQGLFGQNAPWGVPFGAQTQYAQQAGRI